MSVAGGASTMETPITDQLMKKKLQMFLGEMLKMGTVRGFRYFSTYLRGREEMVVQVLNELQARIKELQPNAEFVHRAAHNPNLVMKDDDDNIPGARNIFALVEQTPGESYTSEPCSPQVKTSSGGWAITQAERKSQLPSVRIRRESHISNPDSLLPDDTTQFLLAGYSKYSAPYVWVRSNHEHILKGVGDAGSEKDYPLRLTSTSKWKNDNTYVWDIIADLVRLCTYPVPRNPFAVDFEYFYSLDQGEQILSTAAMVNCLQKILLHSSDDQSYSGKVFEELQVLTRLHFQKLQELVKQKGLPVLQQYEESQQKTAARTWSAYGNKHPNQEHCNQGNLAYSGAVM